MFEVNNKERNLGFKNDYMLARTLTMFEYENLPDTLPAKELELQLQKHGRTFITEKDGDLYALECDITGDLDVYGNPIQLQVNNIPLDINRTYNVDEGVLMYSDYLGLGLIKLFEYYNSMLVENDITFMLNNVNTRIQTLISASDEGTIESAENYLEKIADGELGVIAENAMFEGVKLNNGQKQNNNITSLIEYHQYVKASLYNEIGLNSNFNMKRERLSESENEMNTDILYPLVDSMLATRKMHVEEINEKYGYEISVEFGSVWKKREMEKLDPIIPEENFNETDETFTETEETDETINETIEETIEETDETVEEIQETIDEIQETVENIELGLGGEEIDEEENDV